MKHNNTFRKIRLFVLAAVMAVSMLWSGTFAFADETDAGNDQNIIEAENIIQSDEPDLENGISEIPVYEDTADVLDVSDLTILDGGTDNYRDGVYVGRGRGYHGIITVQITIEDGKITGAEALSHTETESYWEDAVEVFDWVIEDQGVPVDVVAGATRSSNGIKAAVSEALESAILPDNPDAFQTGRGTEENPYKIISADQLAAFASSVDEGNTYEGVYIQLGADIDLSGIENWNPIGDEGAASNVLDKLFNGSFDGAGYTVSGLTITGKHDGWENAGLFASLNTGAQVRNLNISNVNIDVQSETAMHVGALAGDTVGNSEGTSLFADSISTSGNIVLVSENGAMVFSAGLIGRMMSGGAIANSYSVANVTAESFGAGAKNAYAGGIAAMAGNNSIIINCADFGDVYGAAPQGTNLTGYAGGISGMFPGIMLNVYSYGNIRAGRDAASPHSWAGAVVGQMTSKGSSDYVYYASDAQVTLEAWNGGDTHEDSIISKASGSSATITSYIDMEANTDFSKADMQTEAFAEAMNEKLLAVSKLLKDYGLDELIKLNNWTVQDSMVVPAGEVWYSPVPDPEIFEAGTGTAEDPFVISTAEQFRKFAVSLNNNLDYNGYFIALGADIDISDEDWTPVGEGEYAFDGSFNGRGYTVSGMHKGTARNAAELESGEMFFALFGVLGENAVVENLNMTDILINTTSYATAYVAAIAGYSAGSRESFAGAKIDNCHVSGKITHAQDDGNTFVAGITGYQHKGAIINSSSDMDLSGTVNGEALAEVGGIVALVNRGLVANCYSLGDVYGSGCREDDLEGMAVISSIAAVDAGAVAGCYGMGSHTTKEHSVYVGSVSGWVTGVGKAYSCWYNSESEMIVNGNKIEPVESIGTRVTGGVSEDGLVYTGGVVDDNNGFTEKTYADIAELMNKKFEAYPIDITLYGISNDDLSKWIVQDGNVVLGNEKGTINYVQPEAEKYVKPAAELNDGIWYGRDADKKSVVKITVEDKSVTETTVVEGETEGEAFEAALDKACEKATYGDFSHYEEADPSRFEGGEGTKDDPYIIKNREQLEYLSYSVNEDTDWKGVYFRQTADISLEGLDWKPIGWAIEAEINNAREVYCTYPFRGNYDGDDYVITDLTIGSEDSPSGLLTNALFGITDGEYETNEEPTDETYAIELKNIHLENVDVHSKTRYECYTAGLLGSGQFGIFIDNCSATGKVSAETSDSHVRAGGLFASGLRGCVTNSWSFADVSGITDAGRVYAGSFAAMTNRHSVVNCYATGDVYANSTNANNIYAGGFEGMEGGLHINCYAKGNVTADKPSASIGASNGLIGGISVNLASYYNSDAKLIVAGKEKEAVATGSNLAGGTDKTDGRTLTEITGQSFADELNGNIDNISSLISEVKKELEGGSHLFYYKGGGSDLKAWTVKDGIVSFENDEPQSAITLSDKTAVYTGSTIEIDEAQIIGITGDLTYSYFSDADCTVALNGLPVNVGTYYVKAYIADQESNVAKLTIARASSSATAPSANKLTFNNKAQALVKAGTAAGGTMQYSLDNKTFGTALPTAAKAGTYTVYYKVVGDENHNDSAVQSVKVTIAKAANTLNAKAKSKTVSAKSKKKTTIKANKAFKVTKAQGKVAYKKTSGNKKITVTSNGKITVKKGLKKGTYTVKVKVTAAGNANYNKATKTVTIKVKVK